MAMKRTKPARKKPGPKSTFDPRVAEKVYNLALYGMTEREMADILGIGIHTWDKWKRDHKVLKEALERGKTAADIEVVKALYKKCTGFEVQDDHIAVTPKGQVVVTPSKKYFPPDTKAIQMWLSNRTKGRWTTINHHKVEHSGEIRHRQEEVDMSDFSIEELQTLKKYSILQN